MKQFNKFWKAAKDFTSEATSSLFGSKKEEKSQPPSNTSAAYDEEDFSSYLKKKLKSKQTPSNHIDLVLYLCVPEITRIYEISVYQRRAVLNDLITYCKIIQNQKKHEQQILQQTIEFLQSEKGPIDVNERELTARIHEKVRKESCRRILFAKEEIRDQLESYKYMKPPEVAVIKYLSDNASQTLRCFYIDSLYVQTGIDEAEEFVFRLLFKDDAEVVRWFQESDQLMFNLTW